jgi:hypothetical protein
MNFIIATRPYNPKSQGSVLLHKLTDTLNTNGHKAAVILFNGHGTNTEWFLSNDQNLINPDFTYHTFSDLISFDLFNSNAVVIYPEIITGNPLSSKFVVRYMLNREGFIKKGVAINPDITDFILTHSLLYHENPDFHLFHYQGDSLFNQIGTCNFIERKYDITYIGKGSKYVKCYIVDGSKEITREFPSTKAELADMLRQARFFYTWDCLTATLTDAILCGAFPIFMTYEPLTKDEIYNLYDLNIKIPEISYDDTKYSLNHEQLNEINDFLTNAKLSLQKSNDNWQSNVNLLCRQIQNHFRL